MQAKTKRYSIVLRGRVQDVGFRSRIISSAKIYSLRGYPPVNDIDGSVKMICEGPEEVVQKFLKDIEIKEEVPSGILVEKLETKEIPIDFPLPSRFAAVEVEELSNISRKMDVGNESLKRIEGNTVEIKGSLSRVEGNTVEMKGSLERIEDNTAGVKESLGDIKETLDKMNDSLPERIAHALKNVLKS